MHQPVTLTVGIPAYNEGPNIAGLLNELLLQKTDTFVLEKIIVASDGSSDDTGTVARSVRHEDTIVVLENPDRQGLGPRLNQLLETATSDIVVLLNADILIKSRNFLELITAPLREEAADLVSCNMLPMKPRTAVEKAFVFGYEIKNKAFERYAHGSNAFTCHGAARAMNRALYAKLRFPTSVGEDTYSFLFALFHGFRYAYVSGATVHIRLPQTVHDQIRQSVRFYDNERLLSQYFPEAFIQTHLRLPWFELTRGLALQIPVHPMQVCTYLALQTAILFQRVVSLSPVSQTWDVSQSSKSVRT